MDLPRAWTHSWVSPVWATRIWLSFRNSSSLWHSWGEDLLSGIFVFYLNIQSGYRLHMALAPHEDWPPRRPSWWSEEPSVGSCSVLLSFSDYLRNMNIFIRVYPWYGNLRFAFRFVRSLGFVGLLDCLGPCLVLGGLRGEGLGEECSGDWRRGSDGES